MCLVTCRCTCYTLIFFFNDTATTEIYTLSLHDALPISAAIRFSVPVVRSAFVPVKARSTLRGKPILARSVAWWTTTSRSEEHTSELQSRQYLVCRLLLEKKKTTTSLIMLLLYSV